MLYRKVGLVMLLLLSGCDDYLTKMVNEKAPPIPVDEQRQAAFISSAEPLLKPATPNIGVGSSMSDATAGLLTEQLKKEGVVNLRFRGDEQLVRVTADFSRHFSTDDVAIAA